MGRLIDADNLIKLTQKDMEFAFNNGFLDMAFEREHLIKVIRNQPTAYDVDKVVKELEELRRIDRAIEIVKQGGVETDDVCEWTQSGDMAINPHTSSKYKIKQCDGLYALNTCPYCGKKIKVVENK